MNIYPEVLGDYNSIIDKLMQGYAVNVTTPSPQLSDHRYVQTRIHKYLAQKDVHKEVVFKSFDYPFNDSIVLYYFPDTNRLASTLLKKDE